MNSSKLIVGAYAASDLNERFYAGLRSLEWVRGLEIPLFAQQSLADLQWLFCNLASRWEHVLTCMPGTMDHLGSNPKFGLASTSETGRKTAVEFAAQALRTVIAFNDSFKRRSIAAVTLHSAPRAVPEGAQAQSSAEAFSESLREIRSWDWQGAKLCIEHCDRFIPGQTPAKGFLSLEEEIKTIKSTNGTPTGILINWGRSALEGRGAQTPLEHIALAKTERVLQGLIFSGVTQADPLYGNWADSHAPFQEMRKSSLMTAHAARECIVAGADSLEIIGFKIQALPKTVSVEERLSLIKSSGEYISGGL